MGLVQGVLRVVCKAEKSAAKWATLMTARLWDLSFASYVGYTFLLLRLLLLFFLFFFWGGGHLTSILSKGLQCNLFILYFMLTWPTPMTHWCFQRHVCLVDALSSDKKAGKDPNMQALICTIFKGYTGEMLFKFKDEVDTVAQKNMSELVFTVITDVSLQEELLDYFKVEAETLFDEPGTVLIQFNACCTNKYIYIPRIVGPTYVQSNHPRPFL